MVCIQWLMMNDLMGIGVEVGRIQVAVVCEDVPWAVDDWDLVLKSIINSDMIQGNVGLSHGVLQTVLMIDTPSDVQKASVSLLHVCTRTAYVDSKSIKYLITEWKKLFPPPSPPLLEICQPKPKNAPPVAVTAYNLFYKHKNHRTSCTHPHWARLIAEERFLSA